jgi:hypothetical protein
MPSGKRGGRTATETNSWVGGPEEDCFRDMTRPMDSRRRVGLVLEGGGRLGWGWGGTGRLCDGMVVGEGFVVVSVDAGREVCGVCWLPLGLVVVQKPFVRCDALVVRRYFQILRCR